MGIEYDLDTGVVAQAKGTKILFKVQNIQITFGTGLGWHFHYSLNYKNEEEVVQHNQTCKMLLVQSISIEVVGANPVELISWSGIFNGADK